MGLIHQKSVLAVKTEAVSGTIETMTNADAGFKAYDVSMSFPTEFVARPRIAGLGNDTGIPAAYRTSLEFMTYLQGKGATGVPAHATTLFTACGMSLSSTTYSTTDTQSDWKTVSAAHYIDGRRMLARGLMGSWRMTFQAGRPVPINWSYLGAYQATPADQSILTGMSYDNVTTPRWEGANSFTLGGSTAFKASQVEVDLGNQLVHREDPNGLGGYCGGWIANRLPRVTMDPEATLFATKNWFTDHATPTEVDLVLVVNGGSMNTITVTCNDLQLDATPDQTERDGRLVDSLGFEVHGAITIAFS